LERYGRKANRLSVPRLTVKTIIGWAYAHHSRTGEWPKIKSGEIAGTGSDTWTAVQAALHNGTRGLPGGSSLARLLAEHPGVRNKSDLPRLKLKQIRSWAKAYRQRVGRWPGAESGPIAEAPDETWKAVDVALKQGLRGLKGGSSLAKLLGTKKRSGKREIR
jgi:hypothetical protein